MAVHHVTGTEHFIAGQSGRWFVFLNGIKMGQKANFGPFKTKKKALEKIEATKTQFMNKEMKEV
jgi:hypothetical protein